MRKRSRMLTGLLSAALLAGGAAALTPAPAHAEPVYFALEVRRDGQLVAMPKFLGETGRTVRAEKRKPGAQVADYRLVLTPTADGEKFQVELDLSLPQLQGQKPVKGHQEVALQHGEQRKLQLGDSPGKLEVSLLVMKVDSPEFRALMNLGTRETDRSSI